MYFLFYSLVIILFLLFLLIQFFNIITEKNTITYKRFLNILIFLIVISTIVAIIINIYIIKTNYKKTGVMGHKGIDGEQGKTGGNGICNQKCGQKVCYLNVVEYANQIFKDIIKEKDNDDSNTEYIELLKSINTDKVIQNKDFLNKLNKICSSNEYFSTLTKKHKNKPSEQKLIDYIKNIVEEWIKIIIEHEIPKNELFLSYKNKKLDKLIDIGGKNILKELEKYDIFRWGSSEIKIERKKIKIKTNNLKHPTLDSAVLNLIKTNNYRKIYDAEKKQDIWDISECPYDQMGIKKDNPNNLKECIYIDPTNYTKSYKKTWKNIDYSKPQELSIYNSIIFKNKNNQDFYPVGSVWRGKNSDKRPENSINLPPSNTFCGDGHGTNKSIKHLSIGPEKETILISGDVKSPESFEKIWDSKTKCPECQISHSQIFRPIAPKGYTCLGDVSIKWFDDKTDSGKKIKMKL